MTRHNPRRTNSHRRNKLRARILATETHCALCGQPVDKTLHWLDPGAPEVDEIIPVSRGGDPYSRTNTQLAHRICNQRKSNKLEAERTAQAQAAEPITSRAW